MAKVETFCINLDRRPDRWQRIQKHLSQEEAIQLHRVNAFDGKAHLSQEQIASFLSESLLYHSAAEARGEDAYLLDNAVGAIGCWMSHISIWERIIQDYTSLPSGWALILEDDALLCPEFSRRLSACIESIDKKDVDVDVLLLGWYKPQYQYSKELGQETLYRFQGSHAYLVSQRGAAKMLAMAPRMGRRDMKLALDWQIGAWHWSNAIVVDMPEEKLVHQHLRFADSDILSYQPRISSATDSSKGDNVLWRVEDIQPLVAKLRESVEDALRTKEGGGVQQEMEEALELCTQLGRALEHLHELQGEDEDSERRGVETERVMDFYHSLREQLNYLVKKEKEDDHLDMEIITDSEALSLMCSFFTEGERLCNT